MLKNHAIESEISTLNPMNFIYESLICMFLDNVNENTKNNDDYDDDDEDDGQRHRRRRR